MCICILSTDLTNVDDRNVLGLDLNSSPSGKWLSDGEKESSSNGYKGIDRRYTNATSYWTSRSHLGDRYDAWNVGYNEIFSPYSSPSTKNWNDSSTGIFIWYHNLDGNEAEFKIYKATENGGTTSLNTILEATPPSRPMGLTAICNTETFHIDLIWYANQEPDMIDNSERMTYRIYKATQPTMSNVPVSYNLLATVSYYAGESSILEYTDTSVIGRCAQISPDPQNPAIVYPIRYMVKAVDKYSDSSVFSDFASAEGYRWENNNQGGGEETVGPEPDPRPVNVSIPTDYSLKQNFPNPFNPFTNIQYDLPNDEFVTLKIYDLLGKEVMQLVNEQKFAGSYITSFNGAVLASGIYYYSISAGSFTQTKRMVLIK